MKEHLISQGSALVQGVNSFEPFIYQLHSDFKEDKIIDWPTVILATTLQSTAISLFKLLPSPEITNEILDKRSIAALVRNIVDTHDVLDMMISFSSQEEHDLHRNILGLYLSSRVNKVQSFIDLENAEKNLTHTKSWYWSEIKKSPLYTKRMDRLKSGENVFYKSRKERVSSACGKYTDFVMGVLADLSTYVHSIPPAIWMSDIDSLYSDNEKNRGAVVVWLRIASFYYSQAVKIILTACGYESSDQLQKFQKHHEEVFS